METSKEGTFVEKAPVKRETFCEAFLYREGVLERARNGLRDVFSRKPGALKPLDGMRGIAMTWVFSLHTLVLQDYWIACFTYARTAISPKWTWIPWVNAWAMAGDMGVDMFFVLSGFLIAYILMKEHKKYGSIDSGSFFRGRFLRIWFVIAVYAPIE